MWCWSCCRCCYPYPCPLALLLLPLQVLVLVVPVVVVLLLLLADGQATQREGHQCGQAAVQVRVAGGPLALQVQNLGTVDRWRAAR